MGVAFLCWLKASRRPSIVVAMGKITIYFDDELEKQIEEALHLDLSPPRKA